MELVGGGSADILKGILFVRSEFFLNFAQIYAMKLLKKQIGLKKTMSICVIYEKLPILKVPLSKVKNLRRF